MLHKIDDALAHQDDLLHAMIKQLKHHDEMLHSISRVVIAIMKKQTVGMNEAEKSEIVAFANGIDAKIKSLTDPS